MKRPPFGWIRCNGIGKNDDGFGAWNAVGQVFTNAARYFGVSFLFIGCVFFGNKFFLAFYGRAARNAGQTNFFGRFRWEERVLHTLQMKLDSYENMKEPRQIDGVIILNKQTGRAKELSNKSYQKKNNAPRGAFWGGAFFHQIRGGGRNSRG